MSVVEVQQWVLPQDLACTLNYEDGRSSTIKPPEGTLVYLALTDTFFTERDYRNFDAEIFRVASLLNIRELSPALLNQLPEGVKQIQSRQRDGLKTAVEHLIVLEGWAKNHKITGNWNHKRSTKPIGVWLQSILRLCERSHSYARGRGYKTNYRDGFEWFLYILRDFFAAGIADILADLYPEGDLFDRFKGLKSLSKGKGRNTKRFYDSVMNGVCTMAKELEPTHPAYPDWAFNRLLCTAFEAAQSSEGDKKSNHFRRTTYKDFIDAWRTMNRETRDLSITVRLEESGNLLLEQAGKGRDRRQLKSSTAEKLNRKGF